MAGLLFGSPSQPSKRGTQKREHLEGTKSPSRFFPAHASETPPKASRPKASSLARGIAEVSAKSWGQRRARRPKRAWLPFSFSAPEK